MESAISDSSPKVMLLPDSLPLLHSIVPVREEETHPEGVLSTVDIAALNDGGADQGFHMGNNWRSTATPRRREKPAETLKNDKQICNGLKTPCHSEESQESDGSNSDSDSDDSDCSKSSSSSGSSSNCSSCSGSSDSSDSESDGESTASSQSSKAPSKSSVARGRETSPSVPLVNGGGDHSKTCSTKSLYHRVKKKGYASSTESRGSRERKRHTGNGTTNKNYSVNNEYESGSLKLRIAALKPPNQRNENSFLTANNPSRVPSIWQPEETTSETKVVSGERQKSPTKPVKSSPVPEQVSLSPQKKSASTLSSPEKKPSSVSSSPAAFDLQSNKYSTKTNNWCGKSVSPEKKSTVGPTSPDGDKPKKKTKLSCLITSISPKNRLKTANGATVVNGDSSRGLSKGFEPILPTSQSAPSTQQKSTPSAQEYNYHNSSQSHQNHSGRKFSGPNVKTTSSPVSVITCSQLRNEVTFQSNYGSPNSAGTTGQITTPVRTKAAKKYIPEDHLVIPQVVVTPPTPVATPKKTAKKDGTEASRREKKKKEKKSSSKDKKKKNKKKQKKLPSEPEGYKDVCAGLTNLIIIKDGSDKATTKTSVQKPPPSEPFTFALRKYNNIDATMSKFTHPRNSFPRTPIASTSGGRKRKLNIVNDKMMKEAASSRLPLKKRHHHASSVDKTGLGEGGGMLVTGHKFGLSSKPGFVRHSFDVRMTSACKWKAEPSSDFGELLVKSSTGSSSSTHSSSKENDIEVLSVRSSSVGAKRKGGPGRGRKKKSVSASPAAKAASAKKSLPKRKQSIVSPDICDAPEQFRRLSGRVRKPRKLDLDDESKELSVSPSRTPSPQKAPTVHNTRSPKKDTMKEKLESSSETPIVVTAVGQQVAKVDDDITVISVGPSVGRPAKGRSRKRNLSSLSPTMQEVPVKKLKTETAAMDCDTTLNESEISTEVDTDGSVVMMSPPSSASTTPLTSPPQQQQQQAKKRRKVNRTGFPTTRKKKKPMGGKASALVASTSSTPTPSDGAKFSEAADREVKQELNTENEGSSAPKQRTVSIDKKDGIVFIKTMKREDEVTEEDDEVRELSMIAASAPTPSFTTMLSTSGFITSPSERAKMRKRNSVDSRLSMGEGQDLEENKPEIPGLILDLVHMTNAPVVVPPKNNFLPCGLLSNYFKSDDPSTKRMRSWTEGNNPLLPTPPDPESAEFTTTICRDYMLPHDIWCLGVLRARNLYEAWERQKKEAAEAEKAALARIKKEEAAATRLALRRKSEVDSSSDISATGSVKPKKLQLPEKKPSSWSFRKLKSNSYYGMPKPPTSTEFESSCLCEEGSMKCSTDDCLNRVVYTECPATCGENCKNRRIQKHDWAPGIKRILTEEKGFGVFAMEEIKKGDFILEYVGEVVPEGVFKERMHTIYAGDTHHYCLHLDGGLVIDGHRSGGEGRFVNHSCEPNCEMQKWSVAGLSRMALFALRDIKPNEELSYDYNFSLFNPSEGQPCYCGSVKCRGIIGVRAKNGKNGDSNGNGKRGKSLGMSTANNPNGSQESMSSDKMKHLTKKDRHFVQRHNCFLIRNYEKIRKIRHDVEDKVNIGERLEKIMIPWTTRYKAGSTKNKPPQVPEDDVKLVRLARISQIFYELYVKLTTAKDESGALLCQPFMNLLSKRKCPQLYTAMEDPLDLNQVCKKILRGEYRNLSTFELDLGLVLTNFEAALQKEKPGISENIQKIKSFYKGLKAKVMDDLEPFIVHKGSKGSTISNELPKFKEIPVDPKTEDVIRCICERFSDEGTMVQCDKCGVWQHCDCMRVPHSAQCEQKNSRRNNRKQQRRSKFFSPVITPSQSASEDSAQSTPMKSTLPPTASPSFASTSTSANTSLCSPSTPSPRLNTRPLALREEQVCLNLDEADDDLTELILNVKDPIPMEIKEDSNHSVEMTTEPSSSGSSGQEKPTTIDISEMDTQRIDVDGDVEMNGPPPDMVIQQTSTNDSKAEEPHEYFCELCDPRGVDKEVPLTIEDDAGTSNKQHFTTLLREDGFLIRRNDTVYVLRDPPTLPGQVVIDRPTYKTAGPLVPKDCDIFRIESLWKDAEGKRFAYGHHYVRPSETYHEHNRRFYRNEICRSPASESIPIDIIHGRCWVLDPATYCKGRPVGAEEEHVYICEFRVDKSNRSFSKAGKGAHVVCMKPFAFKYFETKIHITRNYHPHGPPSPDFKQKPAAASTTVNGQGEKGKSKKTEEKQKVGKLQSTLERLKVSKRKGEQKERLRRILDSLQSKLQESASKEKTDLSHLLGRQKQVKKLNMPA